MSITNATCRACLAHCLSIFSLNHFFDARTLSVRICIHSLLCLCSLIQYVCALGFLEVFSSPGFPLFIRQHLRSTRLAPLEILLLQTLLIIRF
ncbi:MAG: hypothetical protein CMH42_08470 [Micrococcales bacterium]|nr:hypothetical protein [Micrococcales bacterium]